MEIALFILILVVLIVGHELGHLAAAKLSGMKVPEFGIGFPPRLWGIRIGSTEYTVNALPFGGFVKIVGEDEHGHPDPDAFSRKPAVAQAATLAAGPFANVVLGFMAFWIAFMVGTPAVIEGDAPVVDARVVVLEVLPDSPAAAAGLRTGDELVSVERGAEVQITSPADVQGAIASGEGPVRITFMRGAEERTATVEPLTGLIPEDPDREAVGISSVLVGTRALGPVEALGEAWNQTGRALQGIAVGIVTLIANALTFSASFEDISGPVGIAALVGDASAFGVGQVLLLAAVISLNLAIINLLPLPALDGGRLALVAYEAVVRRPLPEAQVQLVNAIGFFALITLMIAVTWSDIAKLIAG